MGCILMLIKNINPSVGLCNGTRIVVTKVSTFMITGKIVTSSRAHDHEWSSFTMQTTKKCGAQNKKYAKRGGGGGTWLHTTWLQSRLLGMPTRRQKVLWRPSKISTLLRSSSSREKTSAGRQQKPFSLPKKDKKNTRKRKPDCCRGAKTCKRRTHPPPPTLPSLPPRTPGNRH